LPEKAFILLKNRVKHKMIFFGMNLGMILTGQGAERLFWEYSD